MWQTVVAGGGGGGGGGDGRAPCTRSKHAACLLDGAIYVLGGRNGNLPMRDFWRLQLAGGHWEQLRPDGCRLQSLQEHSMVGWRRRLYVFGGEVGFSSGSETPLWCYDTQTNRWEKLSGQRAEWGAARPGAARPPPSPQHAPRGLRGHTAVVLDGCMYVYGGYRDLRGSTGQLWRYQLETGVWQQLHCGPGPTEGRHAHSAVLHDRCMWVYGGMTDLCERADLWKLDLDSLQWTCVRCRGPTPGARHGHVAVRLLAWMLVYGGQTAGRSTTELWRLHFATESWERLVTSAPQPAPRTQCSAVAVSALLLPADQRRPPPPPLPTTAAPPPQRPAGPAAVPVVHADILQVRRRVQVYPRPDSGSEASDGAQDADGETDAEQHTPPQLWTDDRVRFIAGDENRLRLRPADGGPRFCAGGRGRELAAWPSRVQVSGSQLLSRLAQVNLLTSNQLSYSALSNGSSESVEMQTLAAPAEPQPGAHQLPKSLSVYALPPQQAAAGMTSDRCSVPEQLDAAAGPPPPLRPRRSQADGRPVLTGNRPAAAAAAAPPAGRLTATSHSGTDSDLRSTSDYSSIEHCDVSGYDNPNYVSHGAAAAAAGAQWRLSQARDEHGPWRLSQSRDSGIGAERRPSRSASPEAAEATEADAALEPYYPVYMYTLGGKEVSAVTRFHRPLSVWRLQLT